MLTKEIDLALKLAKEASKEIMNLYGVCKADTKDDGSPITPADIKSNKIIVEGIHKEFPNDAIISEEFSPVEGNRTWYVDPLDGTSGFLKGNDEFAIHIALCENKKPILGLIYSPITNESIISTQNNITKIDSKGEQELIMQPKKVNEKNVNEIIAVLPRRSEKINNDLYKKLNIKKFVSSGGEGLRMLKLITGEADFMITESANTWDVCAPHAILNAAGGVVELEGGLPLLYQGQGSINKKIIYARNKKIMKYIQDKLKVIE